MNKKLKFELIRQAQRLLVENPQDYAHELTHHMRVWTLAGNIGTNISEAYDQDILEVICWWHDIDTNTGDKNKRIAVNTAHYVSNLVKAKDKSNIFDSIQNHEFGSKPAFIEGKILQDADKLEILSVERLRILQEAVDLGLYDRGKFVFVIKDVTENWLPIMPERYNFEYSKVLHEEKLRVITPLLDKIHSTY